MEEVKVVNWGPKVVARIPHDILHPPDGAIQWLGFLVEEKGSIFLEREIAGWCGVINDILLFC